ncbi:hypothetical protein MMC29_001088, partial [Sticta canariensis]|nr:hypothetical protein [Sticta canariensis]
MSRFLLLVIISIWTRISLSNIILEPSASDDTSLAIDTSNPFDPGRHIIGSEVASIDAESNLFANGELTPSYDCFSYNVPSKAKLRARRCDYSNLRTKSQTVPGGETQTSPKSHGGRDPQEPNGPSDETNSPPSDAEPEEEFDGVLTNVIVKDHGFNAASTCAAYSNTLFATTPTSITLFINPSLWYIPTPPFGRFFIAPSVSFYTVMISKLFSNPGD